MGRSSASSASCIKGSRNGLRAVCIDWPLCTEDDRPGSCRSSEPAGGSQVCMRSFRIVERLPEMVVLQCLKCGIKAMARRVL